MLLPNQRRLAAIPRVASCLYPGESLPYIRGVVVGGNIGEEKVLVDFAKSVFRGSGRRMRPIAFSFSSFWRDYGNRRRFGYRAGLTVHNTERTQFHYRKVMVCRSLLGGANQARSCWVFGHAASLGCPPRRRTRDFRSSSTSLTVGREEHEISFPMHPGERRYRTAWAARRSRRAPE